MSIEKVYSRNKTSPAFDGRFDREILARAAELSAFYTPHFVERKVTSSLDTTDIDLNVYEWKSPRSEKQTRKPPLCIILNGIYTRGRSNDHTAFTLSQECQTDVVCFDYPGKGSKSSALPTKEDYTPRMYATLLRDLIGEYIHDYDDIFLMGYSHGARIIYDLYDLNWDSEKIKGVIIGDMGPERPADAAQRRARRNQHSPVYRNLTEAIEKLTHFFNGHGRSLPEDFVIHTINQNFQLVDDGDVYGFQYGYDPRSMFGYCDEIQENPLMHCWRGFHRINAPILFMLGADSNTVPENLLTDMRHLKQGKITLDEIVLSRKIMLDFSSASSGLQTSPFFILAFEGTGHYPEPHRISHVQAVADFIKQRDTFSVRASLKKLHDSGICEIPPGTLAHCHEVYGVLPMPSHMDEVDLLPFMHKSHIVPR